MVQHCDHRSTKLFCCAVYLMNEVLSGQNLVQLQSTLLRMRNAQHHYWHGNLQPHPPMAPPTNLNSRWCPMGQPLLPSSECWARQVLTVVYPEQCTQCGVSYTGEWYDFSITIYPKWWAPPWVHAQMYSVLSDPLCILTCVGCVEYQLFS